MISMFLDRAVLWVISPRAGGLPTPNLDILLVKYIIRKLVSISFGHPVLVSDATNCNVTNGVYSQVSW